MKTKILTTLIALLFSSAMIFAQDTTKMAKKQMMKTNTEVKADSVYYTCTMHPDVKLDKPGKCPECGMDLVKKTVVNTNKSEGITSYTCTMHPEVSSANPGKCPKCGMDLVPKK